MIENWREEGSPEWHGRAMSNFEEWSRIIGGILDVNGVKGFLGSQAEARRVDISDEDEDEAMIVHAVAMLMWGIERWTPGDLYRAIRFGPWSLEKWPYTTSPSHPSRVTVHTEKYSGHMAFLADWLRVPATANDRAGAIKVGEKLKHFINREYETDLCYNRIRKPGRYFEVDFRKTKDAEASIGSLRLPTAVV
jgi:hypothetical protein